MLSRVLAFALAACLAATGVLPALDGYRCVAMDRTMSAEEDCPRCHSTPPISIGNPCCEPVHVSSLEARAPAPSHEVRIAPAPLAAVLLAALPQLQSELIAADSLNARPRGRPAPPRSTILRI